MAAPILDVLILGGGPAGLSVATVLARQLYTAVVFDSGVYRNALATHMHNVVGWDHIPPAQFRAKGRADILARYQTVEFADVEVTAVKQTDSGRFEAVDVTGKTWVGKKLVLATGVKDIPPSVEGYGKLWGKGIFHCLFCHGYEERGVDSIGVLALDDCAAPKSAMHFARMALRLTKKVNVYTDGSEDLASQIQEALKGSKAAISIDSRAISRLEKGAEETSVIVNFKDGSSVQEGFFVHKPRSGVNGPFAKQLGVEINEQGDLKTNGMFHETNVNGVFAVGDCATPMKVVATAIAMGAFSAVGLASQLQMEPF